MLTDDDFEGEHEGMRRDSGERAHRGRASKDDAHRAHSHGEQASHEQVPRQHTDQVHEVDERGQRSEESKKQVKHSRKDLEKHVEEMVSELDALKAALEETKDRYLRALADFDNYRKRVARENEERTRCANEDIIGRLLEVVDNMERAFEASAEARDFEGLRKGIELTYLNLKEVLTKEGLCPIKCLGEKFDPNYHEAIMALDKEGAQPERVIEEVQKGYTLNGRVIRPSKVVVSK